MELKRQIYTSPPVLSTGQLIHTGRQKDMEELVCLFHYSHRYHPFPGLVVTAHEQGGLFGDLGEAVAGVAFHLPHGGYKGYKNVWELTRLVRKPGVKLHLSELVSRAVRLVPKRQIDLLISYADAQQNNTEGKQHHGGIYQACSWNYSGLGKAKHEGFIIGDTFVPMRSVKSFDEIKKMEDRTGTKAIKKIDKGKHLYWKSLTIKGDALAVEFGLRIRPYPKPSVSQHHLFDIRKRS